MVRSPRANVRPILACTSVCITPGSWYSTGSSIVAIERVAPLALAVAAAALVGLAAGIPFAPAFAGAARARPEAPAAAVGLVNMTAAVTILVATPLVGVTFSLPGEGRVGFVAVAALWALAAVSVQRNGH